MPANASGQMNIMSAPGSSTIPPRGNLYQRPCLEGLLLVAAPVAASGVGSLAAGQPICSHSADPAAVVHVALGDLLPWHGHAHGRSERRRGLCAVADRCLESSQGLPHGGGWPSLKQVTRRGVGEAAYLPCRWPVRTSRTSAATTGHQRRLCGLAAPVVHNRL